MDKMLSLIKILQKSLQPRKAVPRGGSRGAVSLSSEFPIGIQNLRSQSTLPRENYCETTLF